ncbi:MAG: hypothetical protein BWY71_02290 [Planctomycetes bacterium ADurb.Bin412]|nr:MAG: hypothetical protein BWY71_02290 [Planctomycetes bacterium ADurb.Bin412]
MLPRAETLPVMITEERFSAVIAQVRSPSIKTEPLSFTVPVISVIAPPETVTRKDSTEVAFSTSGFPLTPARPVAVPKAKLISCELDTGSVNTVPSAGAPKVIAPPPKSSNTPCISARVGLPTPVTEPAENAVKGEVAESVTTMGPWTLPSAIKAVSVPVSMMLILPSTVTVPSTSALLATESGVKFSEFRLNAAAYGSPLSPSGSLITAVVSARSIAPAANAAPASQLSMVISIIWLSASKV